MATVAEKISFASFCGGKEPTFIFEDEQCVVFDETQRNKQAPVHFLVVPKKVIPRLVEASLDDEKLLGHMLLVAKKVAIDLGVDRTGYHVIVDESHQKNDLRSLHVFGRALHHMVWPMGPGSRL